MSLLEKYYVLRSYSQLATGAPELEGVGGGAIILQKAVPIEQGDNEDILQYRVMRQAEWEILPRAVSLFCEERIRIVGNRTEILGATN